MPLILYIRILFIYSCYNNITPHIKREDINKKLHNPKSKKRIATSTLKLRVIRVVLYALICIVSNLAAKVFTCESRCQFLFTILPPETKKKLNKLKYLMIYYYLDD